MTHPLFQEMQDPLTNLELVNKTENIFEEIIPIVEDTESKQEMPKFEEIKVRPVFIGKNDYKEMESIPGLKKLADERHNLFQQYIKDRRKAECGKGKYLARPRDLGKCPKCQKSFSLVDEYARHINKCVQEQKNPCSQCNATFTTKRRLSIHIELAHEEKKENIEMPKPKKQKTDSINQPVMSHCEMLTKRRIFDYIYSLKITPGIYRHSEYQKLVLETVISFKNVTIDKLSESSVQKLETNVKGLTSEIYEKWPKCGYDRDGLYRKFQNNMEDLFDWVPELEHEVKNEKTENIEIPKIRKQKNRRKDQPLLTPTNPDEMVTKRQIFDDIYSRKITPGKCRNSDYQKHVMETVLSFYKLTIDKLSESSVQKLELKVRSLTCVIYEKWRKIGSNRDRLYEKFPNNMQDPFAWVPELLQEENSGNINEMPKIGKQNTEKRDIPLMPLSNSCEFLTKRQIFDDMYSRKITPGNYRTSEYQKIVLETVLSLKKVTLEELSESSVQKLELKAKGLTNPIYVKWRKCGCHRNGLYKKFQNNMEDPFDWIPELKEN